MFPGFTRPSYTPVPDEVFDNLLRTLTHNELRVLLYICRRTFGFGKDADAISFNQFLKGIVTQDGRRLDHGCGITNATRLSAALKSLETGGYISAGKGRDARGENTTTIYRLRFHTETDGTTAPAGGVLPDRQYRTTGSINGVLPDRQGQETVLQETEQQDSRTKRRRGAATPQLPLRTPLPALPETPEAVWSDVLALLREQASPTNYATYLADTRLIALTEDQATIQAPDRQQAAWLAKHWPSLLERALTARLGRRVRARVVPPR